MKKISITALALLPAMAFAQNNYKLSGTVGKLNKPAKAYLMYNAADKTQIDSADLVNGAFSFAGTIDGPVKASLMISHDGQSMRAIRKPDAFSFYLEPKTLQMKAADSISKSAVVGSKLNEEYQALQTQLKPGSERYSKLYAEYQAASEEQRKSKEFQASINERSNAISEEKEKIQVAFAKSHPNSPISLDLVKDAAGAVPDYNKVKPMFDGLSASVRESASGKRYEAYLTKLSATAIGATAPEFSQPDTAGKMISLSSFRGKYVLVDFWASWCGPCRAENPNLVKDYGVYHAKGLEVLGVSLDQPGKKDAWLKAIHTDKLTWTQVSDLKYWKNEVADLYAVRAIPQNFLISPEGKIIGKNLRGEELTKKLEELFGKAE